MRFSLRTILLTFVIVGLALATILTTWKLKQAEREIQRVRAVYGVVDPGSFQLSRMGIHGDRVNDLRMIHLIHLGGTPEDYRLRFVFYDGLTQKSQSQYTDLFENDFEMPILLNYSDHEFYLWLGGMNGPQTITSAPFKFQGDEKLFSYPSGLECPIDDRPFLIYIFCPPDLDDEPNFQWIGQDEEKLIAWCDKYQAKTVYFKFQRLPK